MDAPCGELLGPMVRATRGHPLAIRLAAAQLRAGEPDDVVAMLEDGAGAMAALARELWEPAWYRAGPPTRAVVRAACAAPGPPSSRSRLAEATSFNAADLTPAIAEAVDLGLLMRVADALGRGYWPGLFLRRYLRRVPYAS